MKQNQDAIRREQQLQNKIDEQFAEIGRQSALLQEYLTDSTKTSLPQPEKYASSSLTDERSRIISAFGNAVVGGEGIYRQFADQRESSGNVGN